MLFLQRCRHWLAGLSGWRRYLAALALGVVGTAAMPPVEFAPALLVFAPLIWLEQAAPGRRASFLVGTLFGLGFFASGLYWIVHAYLVPPAEFAALGVPSVAGLALLLSLFTGAACLLLRLVLARLPAGFGRGPARVLLFAACYAAMEWARGHVLTGFPWNLPAYGWNGVPEMLQGAALVGAYGLSLVTVALLGMPAVLGDPAVPAARARGATLAAAALLALMAAGGAWRLSQAQDAVQPGIRLRLVQPNVAQADKWQPENRNRQFDELLALSRQPAERPITLVVWPETAVVFPLDRSELHREAVARALPPGGYLLTGAPRWEIDERGRQRAYNSLLAIDSQGRVLARYDKFHLVPFGEYIPFNDILPWEQTIGRGSFTPGPGPRTVALPGMPAFSPLICYEIIFPGAVVDAARPPAWLLNVTNDAWFGVSSGPFQHFASARMRAVEEGLPLIRVANTGISAVTDAYGRVKARLGLEVAGVIDTDLPVPSGGTPYARLGDATFLLLILLCLALAAVAGRRYSGRPGE